MIRDTKLEKAALNAISDEPSLIDDYGVSQEDFSDTLNGNMFKIIKKLYNNDQNVNELNLFYLADGFLEEHIEEVLSNEVSEYQYEDIFDRLKSLSTRRKLRRVINEIDSEIERNDNIDELCDQFEQKLLSITEEQLGEQDWYDSMDIASSFGDELEKRAEQEGTTGVPTGFYELDRMTAGFQDSHLIYIGGRPGMGKTSFALQLALNASSEGYKTLIFSLEMVKEELAQRLVSNLGNIAQVTLRAGIPKEEEKLWQKATQTLSQLGKHNILVDDTPSLSVEEVRSRTRRAFKTESIDMVMVDYLQLLSSRDSYERKSEQYNSISKKLRAIARELSIPVVCLTQLNRKPESRNDKRPMLSDVKESGGPEEDGNLVMFLYREDYYDPSSDNREGTTELIVAKQRNGPTGILPFDFQAGFSRFKEM